MGNKINRLFICEMDKAAIWADSDQANITSVLNNTDYVLLYHTGTDNPKTNGSIQIVNRILKAERGEIINVMDITKEGIAQNISNQIMHFYNPKMDVYFVQGMQEYMKEVLAKTNTGYYKEIKTSKSLHVAQPGRRKESTKKEEQTTNKETAAQKETKNSRNNNDIVEIEQKRKRDDKSEVNSKKENNKTATTKTDKNTETKKTKNKEPIDMGDDPFSHMPNFESREQFDKSTKQDDIKKENSNTDNKQDKTQEKEEKTDEEEEKTRTPGDKSQETSFGMGNDSSEWGSPATSRSSKKKQDSPTFDELERIIFNARKSGVYEERQYTDLENAKAKTVALLEERLKQNINTLIPLFAALDPSDRDYIRMVSLLSFATTFENFCESWESMEPSFKLQGFKKEIYNALREEAVYYVKVCDMLYSQDIWG